MKKRFFLAHKKSSALVVSVIIHVVFIGVALTFIAVQVYVRPEQVFEVKDVKRPIMKLRKLQVPVQMKKKTHAPKLRKNIVAKPKAPSVDIKMPDIVGVPGGTGYGQSGELGVLGFGFDMERDLFGSNRGTGNEFIGTFYDLKQTPAGDLTSIGKLAEEDSFKVENQHAACKVIYGFVSSGFKEGRLKHYFKAPKLKYATTVMLPPMSADAAPKAFGVEGQVTPSYWICHYKGQIAVPETGRYRFCGMGDDILVVRVGDKIVLDGCWPTLIGKVTSWHGRDDNNRRYSMDGTRYGPVQNFQDVYEQIDRLGGYDKTLFDAALGQVRIDEEPVKNAAAIFNRMAIGDWVPLRKGEAVNVDILIGEIPGGSFSLRLLIEQEGKDYKMVESDAGPRPILPVFKMTPVAPELVAKMELDPQEMTLDGPVFGAMENKEKKAGGL